MQSAAAYSITALGTQPPLAVQGRVDSISVMANGRPITVEAKHPYAVFAAQLSPIGALENVKGADSTRCPNAVDPAVANVYSLFVPVPTSVSIGSTWEDSIVTTTCRGDLPITTTSSRRYTLDGTTTWNGRDVLRITRSTATTVQSDTTTGRAFGVAGQGSGTATLLVDPATATLYQSTGTAQARLTIGTSRAKTVFLQQVADTATLRP